MRVDEVMDLPDVSSFWGSRLGERPSVGGDSDYDFRSQSDDLSVGYDSEEEQRNEMEESLYCQMYFKENNVKCVENGEEESKYDVSNLSHSDLLLSLHSKENKLCAEGEEGVKDMKRQRNEDDVTKSNKKLKKSRMVGDTNENSDKKLFPNNPPGNETISSTDSRIAEESFQLSDVVLVPTDSEGLELSTDSGPYLVEDESEIQGDNRAWKEPPEKCKRDQKRREEVIDVSDTSSDSSLFLDISTDDEDIDVHMVKSQDAGDQGENDEHLQAILNSLPECDWKINNTDRLGSSSAEKPRYYNSASKFRCHNCNQRGHFTHACPQPKKVIACILCGNRGHFSKYCSQSLCFRCNRPGHTAKECSRKRKWHEDACCRCGTQGHSEIDCPDNWRQYHLTISSKIVKGPKLENHRKFCYNCALIGHFGHECRRRQRDSYVQPLSPFITKYDRNRDKRSHAKDAILQNESLSASVAGSESFLDEHMESKCQKEGDEKSYRRWLYHTDIRSEGKNLQQRNHDPHLEFDRRRDVDKGNLSGLTNFARKIKDKLFGVNRSAKKSPKKPKKAKDVLQLNYLPLTTDVSGSEGNTYHGFQRPTELLSDMNASSNNTSSFSKSIACHTSMDGLYAGDFPRSGVKSWKNQSSVEFKRKKTRLSNYSDCSRSEGEYFSQQLQFTTPRELKVASKRFLSGRNSKWQQTSTPVGGKMTGHPKQSLGFSTPEATYMTGHQRTSHELSPSDMLQLEGDQILTAYYGKSQIRNARRKERKKEKRAMLAQDEANLSVKSSSSGRNTQKKKKKNKKRDSSDRVTETDRGFRI